MKTISEIKKYLMGAVVFSLCFIFLIDSAFTANLAEKLDVDPTTGTAVTSIALEVVPGRGGIQPNLNLLYNSSSANGPLGMGWLMDLGSIQRSTKRGTPQYTNADIFTFMQSGSQQEMVDISGNGSQFRFEFEGAFMKMEFVNNSYWLLTDKKGTKYRFGFQDASRQRDYFNPSRVFKWCLDYVEDVQGNFMTIDYIKDGTALFPKTIAYTGNSKTSLAPFASVEFNWEDRPDRSLFYFAGFEMHNNFRLSSVEIKASNTLQRKYTFQYIQDSQTTRSLLTRVTQFGSYETFSLPPMIFNYSNGMVRYSSPTNMSNYPNRNLGEGTTRLMDMNNDGFLDLVEIVGASASDNFKIYFNDGTGKFLSRINAVNTPDQGMNPDLRFHDLNGDGLMDVIRGNVLPYRVWINNGVNGYESPKSVGNSPNISISHQNLVQFVDMNGDGKLDLVETYSGNDQNYKIYFNTGSGEFSAPIAAVNSPIRGTDNPDMQFIELNGDGLLDVLYGGPYTIWINNGKNGFNPPTTISNHPEISITHQNLTQFVDMNGDGLTDILRSNPGNNQPYSIYYNTGNSYFTPPISASNPPIRGTDNTNVKLADMNGDGLVDVFMGLNGVSWNVWINNGKDGFYSPVLINDYPSGPNLDDGNLMLADLNADNLPDMLWGTSGSPYRTWFSQSDNRSAKPNVLVKIDNSIGGITELEYSFLKVSCLLGWQYKIVYNPILFNTVNKITRKTVQGDSYPIRYFYKYCDWSHKSREFRGFGYAKVIDAEGNYSETKYLQDDIYKGRISEQASFNAQGALLGKTINNWDVKPNVNFVYLKRVDQIIYKDNAPARWTAQEFFYDETPQLGNLTKSIQLGEVNATTGVDDIGNDTRRIETDYRNNTTNWLIGLPKEVRTFDYAGNLSRKSWYFYDGDLNNSTAPSKGLLTLKRDWAGDATGTVHPETEYAYDAYGNIQSTKDALKNITSIQYDPTYQMFPILTTNALNHKIEKEFYGVNGVALNSNDGFQGMWGQIKSTTDPNDQKLKRTYDTFGRTVKTFTPMDSLEFPTTSYEYEITPQYSTVTSHARVNHGQIATIDSKTFYDGLGRVIQSKTMSQLPGQYVVSGQSQYNSRGLKIKQYLPFFSTTPLANLDPMNTAQPFAQSQYDAQGRAIEVINTDGTRESVIYDNWTTATIDANGHMQKSYSDAYGRLIKKEEYIGADGRSNDYLEQNYALYATTRYVYDSEGNLLNTIDDHNNTTTITYDYLGRKISMDDPDMGYWQYGYDLNGNLKWQIDAKSQRLDFTYDALNRLKNKTDNARINVNYTYEDDAVLFSKGRLTKADYDGGLASFKYDALGRETKSIKNIDANPFNLERSYDALSNLKEVAYPNAEKISYQYNVAGQIQDVKANYDRVPAPQAPVLNPATAGDQTVYLSWNIAANATSYIIKYGTTSGEYSNPISVGNVNSYPVTGLINDTTYYLVVAARNSVSESVSNEVTATPRSPAPVAPVLNEPVVGNGQVTLSWNAVQGAAYYKVKYRTSSAGLPDVNTGSQTSTTINNLTNGTTYYFTVLAGNNGGESVPSNEKVAAPIAPPSAGINFDNTSSTQADNVNTINWNHTVTTTGTNRVLVVNVAMKRSAGTPSISSLKYGGVSMTKIRGQISSSGGVWYSVEQWYLLNPPIGTNAITATFNASINAVTLSAVSMTGVKQAAPLTSNYKSGTSTSASIGITVNTKDAWIVDSLMVNSTTDILTPGAGQTDRFNQINSDAFMHKGSSKVVTVSGANTTSWSFSSSKFYIYQSAAFAPATTVAMNTNNSPPILGGVRGGDGILQTIATTVQNFFSIPEAWAAMGLDLTTFTATPSGNLTVTSDCVNFNNIETLATNAYVTKSYPVSGNFNFQLDTILTSSDTFSGDTAIWGISNNANTTVNNWTSGIYLGHYTSGSIYRLRLTSVGSSTGMSAYLTKNRRYYLSISRTGSVVSVSIYSDTARATLVSTITQTNASNFSYLYAFSTKTGTALTRRASGDVCHVSDQNGVVPPSPPTAPVLNNANAGNNSVSLSWNAVSGATGYKVKFGLSSRNYTETRDAGAAINYTVSGLTNGAPYYFVVVAYNVSQQESALSNEITATPTLPIPSAPVLNDALINNQNVTLSWSDSANATGYKIKYGTQLGTYSTTIDAGNVLSYPINNLPAGATYYFVVSAYNSSEESGPSREVSAVIASTVINQTIISSVDYNVNGQISKIVYGNGTTTEQEYYPLNFRLKRILTVNLNGESLQDFVYTYDAVGNIKTITDNVHTATQNFTYDALNRLVDANGLTYGHKTFVYDTIGNIKEKDGLIYAYGENGAGPHAVTSLSNGTVINYDANGNMSRKSKNGEVREFIYDSENRLVEAKKNTNRIATYEYDGDGGRTKRTVYTAANNSTCFLPGTPVLMADGKMKAIEKIKVGDEVLGFDEKSLKKIPVKVTQTFDHELTDSYVLVNDSLKVTADHQFFTQGKWKAIGEMSVGGILLNNQLTDEPIKKLEKIQLHKKIQVYNIEVEASDDISSLAKIPGASDSQNNNETGHGISSVHNYFAGGYLVHNKTVQFFENSTTTTYVGSLYEETNGVGTEFIFLGSSRVASIIGNDIRFYHDDHLGGTNVITSASGALQELIEYKPFGEFARQEKSDATAPAQPYYFTGKPLDDETGLYYYGARYYDPQLGRFITADDLIQNPTDPQTLNRYSYTSNNPVNRTDPTGHGWKKFWDKWAGLFGMVGGVIKGISTGDWSTLQNMGTALLSSAIFSGGNPFAIAAAVVSAGFLDTPSGNQFTKFLSNEVFDDALGFSPGAAYFLGNMASSAIISSAVYVAITPETYAGPDLRDPKNRGEIEKYGLKEKNPKGGTTTNKMAKANPKNAEWLKQGRIASQNGWSDIPGLGKMTEALGINHTSVVVQTSKGFFDSALDSDLLNPFKHGDLWGAPWTGTCEQVSFATLIEKGGMSGIQAFKTVAQSNGWTYYVTSAVYGVRADFGGVGLALGATNQRDYQKK